MANSKNVVEECIWRSGEKQELTEKYFICTSQDTDQMKNIYELRKDLSKPVEYEFKTYFKKQQLTNANLSIRYIEYKTCNNAIDANNLRSAIVKNAIDSKIKIIVNIMFIIYKENDWN